MNYFLEHPSWWIRSPLATVTAITFVHPALWCVKSIKQMGKMLSGRLWIWKRHMIHIDRYGMWQMLRVYGVGGKLMKAVQSFYVDSMACVYVGNDVSEWFPAMLNWDKAVWCIHRCLMYYDYMVWFKRLMLRCLGKGWNGGKFEINQLLFADDTALVPDSE